MLSDAVQRFDHCEYSYIFVHPLADSMQCSADSEEPATKMTSDALWSDPTTSTDGIKASTRGAGIMFGILAFAVSISCLPRVLRAQA